MSVNTTNLEEWCEMYIWNFQDCHSKSSIQQEDSFHEQIGLKIKEDTSTVLHSAHSFVWCWNLDTSESRSEIPWKFRNVVLEKHGGHLDYHFGSEVLQRVKEDRNILHTIKIGKPHWNGHILHKKCPQKDNIEGKIEGRIQVIRRQGRRRQ